MRNTTLYEEFTKTYYTAWWNIKTFLRVFSFLSPVVIGLWFVETQVILRKLLPQWQVPAIVLASSIAALLIVDGAVTLMHALVFERNTAFETWQKNGITAATTAHPASNDSVAGGPSDRTN